MAIKMKDNKSSLATSLGIGIFSFNQIIAILSTVELSQFESERS